uniref:Uncharacterized protein n=1 Tax=Tanacetum cinerariifolium TaxID=118510 RepID=A0A699IR40_TANCI|nr:hypothetical protein [Tanacetum cinerariifolium]
MGIRIPQSNVPSSVADKAITKEMHDGLRRATTTASSLEAEQGSVNISKTQTKATPSGPSSPRTSSEGGPGGEGNMQILELMDICTKLPSKVTTLENELKSTKAIYNKALITLIKRVKKLEFKLKHKRRRAVVNSSEDEEASLDKEDSPKQGRMIEEINKDENTNLVKSTKDKGKAIMQESDPPKKIKKKEMILISLDEEISQRFYEEEQAQLLMDEEYDQQVQAQCSLVKEMFNSSNPTEDKEIALWVELKRLFERDEDDELWKFKSFELIWRLYDWCEVHHISTRDGQDIFMLVKKEYPLSRGALLMMLVQKLQVDEHNEMAKELIRKIFMQEERPKK